MIQCRRLWKPLVMETATWSTSPTLHGTDELFFKPHDIEQDPYSIQVSDKVHQFFTKSGEVKLHSVHNDRY